MSSTLITNDRDGIQENQDWSSLVRVVALLDKNGDSYGVEQIDGKPRVSSMPYAYDIAEGHISEHQAFGGFGSRDDIAIVSGGVDMWTGSASVVPIPADAGEQLSVVSTSVQDNPSGTGAHELHIYYLDADGVMVSEVLELDGTTEVDLIETNVRFVQDIHVHGAKAAGLITIYKKGASTTIYSEIEVGDTQHRNTSRMVPANSIYYITDVYVDVVGADKVARVNLMITAHKLELISRIFLPYGEWANTYGKTLTLPLAVPAFAIVKFASFVPTGKDGAYVSAGHRGWIESA